VGVRRPGHRRLPSETRLDRDRATRHGQGRGVPGRPRLDPILGSAATQGPASTGLLHPPPAVQAGRPVPPVRRRPVGLRRSTPDPSGLGMVAPLGHQEGDQGGLPRPPRPAQPVTRSSNTPRARPTAPGRNNPSGARAPCCNSRRPEPLLWLAWAGCAGTRLSGPEGAPAQQCVGATWRSSLRHRERILHRRMVIVLASQSRVAAEIATAAVNVSQRPVGSLSGVVGWYEDTAGPFGSTVSWSNPSKSGGLASRSECGWCRSFRVRIVTFSTGCLVPGRPVW